MNPTAVRTRSVEDAVSTARAAVEALAHEQDHLGAMLRAAIDAGDASVVLAVRQSISELPVRRQVAQCVLLRARIANLRSQADSLRPASVAAEADATNALAAYRAMPDATPHADRVRAREDLAVAEAAARIATGPVRELERQIKQLDRELGGIVDALVG